MTRAFEIKTATRERSPLIVGITGPSGSGKTYSALRLATGIQRVTGGELFVIDTEARRATHYAEMFRFKHLDFAPPFGPLDYLDAIETCVKAGARVIVIDSMSHEHSGDGGVLDRADRYLDEKAGDDWKRREALKMSSFIAPKRERRILNQRIVQLGGVVFVLCYRAHEKIKMGAKGTNEEKVSKAWTPETTSDLVYDMTQRFLLKPGGNGTPNIAPTEDAEKQLVKSPEQFRGWIKSEPLTEDLGEKLARWAQGGAGANTQAKPSAVACFRGNIEWSLQETWAKRPLADAGIDALLAYREACAELRANTTKQAAVDALTVVLDEVDAAIAAKEPRT